jgi:hypothetical protein
LFQGVLQQPLDFSREKGYVKVVELQFEVEDELCIMFTRYHSLHNHGLDLFEALEDVYDTACNI